MTTDNETEVPVDLDMELVEQQLKNMKPEQFEEVASRLNSVAASRREEPSKLAGMPDHEFSAFVLKKFGYYPGV